MPTLVFGCQRGPTERRLMTLATRWVSLRLPLIGIKRDQVAQAVKSPTRQRFITLTGRDVGCPLAIGPVVNLVRRAPERL